MDRVANLEPCPGCGERLPRLHGATHPYVGASSACWTRFSELSAALPVDAGTPLRRLVTDAYLARHPGVPERRAIQSVGLHLVALHLVLVVGLRPVALAATLQRASARPPGWRWLDPPVPNGEMTPGDLAAGVASGRAVEAIEGYVRGVWSAWALHHPTVAGWARDAAVA